MSLRTPRPSRSQQEVIDWEHKYHELYKDHQELKSKSNKQEETIKKLQTNNRKLEADISQLELKTGQILPKAVKRDREEDDLINTLYDQISKYKHQASTLIERNKQLADQLERKKRELAVAQKLSQSSANSTSKRPTTAPLKDVIATEIEIRPGPTTLHQTNQIIDQNFNNANSIKTDPTLLQIATSQKSRIKELEDQLEKLRNELSKFNQVQRNETSKPDFSADLQSKLRDTTWQLQQLQTQYDHMASKAAAQSQTVATMTAELENYSTKVRDLRRALEDLKYEKELSDIKANRLDEIIEQNNELIQINNTLENRFKLLCDNPYINDAFRREEINQKYEDILQERNQYKTKIEHLQEAVRTNFSALTTLKNQFLQLKKEKDEVVNENELIKSKYSTLEQNNQQIHNQLKLYTDDDGIDIETLERALTLVKRKSNVIAKLPFLEKTGDEDDELITLPLVKKKYEQIQIINIQLNDEVSRLENILKLQIQINKDLHEELNSILQKKEYEKSDLENTLQQYKDLSNKKQEKIIMLEAQLRQHIYSSAKKGINNGIIDKRKGSKTLHKNENDFDSNAQNLLLSDFLSEKDGYIQPDENLLEIWIKNCVYRENVIKPGSSTFVMIDFFDYESQSTSLQTSTKPFFDFAISYKLVIDDFLIRYLASDVVTIEVNMAVGGDFSLLARSAIPLNGLLRSTPVIQLVNHPLLSVENGALIGHISLDLRLALPISEFYRLFLERHPLEKRFIEDISSRRVIESMSALEHAQTIESTKQKAIDGIDPQEESRLYNELEVSFVSAKNLKLGENNQPPSSYLYFQLLAFPDKFTNPVPHTTEPKYQEVFSFPMVTNDYQLRLLRTSRLLVSVIDMNVEGQDKPHSSSALNDGLIGEVSISLADLSDGLPIDNLFNIKQAKNITGQLQVSIKWKYPLRNQRELGPRALSNADVETIISAFSMKNSELMDGLVDYKSFCRYMNPPREIKTVIEKLKIYIKAIIENKMKSNDFASATPYDVCKVLFDNPITEANEKSNSDAIDEDEFVQSLLKTKIDSILPIDYANFFHYIDTNNLGHVTVDQFLTTLDLNNVMSIPFTLQDKLRQRSIDLLSRSIQPIKIFEDTIGSSDYNRLDGYLTRSEFKLGLKNLGFTLVDESEALYYVDGKNDYKSSIKNKSNHETNSDLTSDDPLKPTYFTNIENLRKENEKQRQIFESQKNELIQKSKLTNEKHIDENSKILINPVFDKIENDEIQQKNYAIKSNQSLFDKKDLLDDTLDSTVESSIDNILRPTSSNLKTEPNSTNAGIHENADNNVKNSHREFLSRNSKGPFNDQNDLNVPSSQIVKSTLSQGKFTPSDNDSKNIRKLSPTTTALESFDNFFTAEINLIQSLETIKRTQKLPDLLTEFKVVDKHNEAFVTRPQFAFTLKNKFPSIELHGIYLRAMMDYFDSDKTLEGGRIQYKKFIKYFNYFYNNGYPKYLPMVELLYEIVLTEELKESLYIKDKFGKGYITRADMMGALISNGYKHIEIPILTSIILMFETDLSGEVNYFNFIEVISENFSTKSYENLKKILITQLSNKGDLNNESITRHWFKLITKDSSKHKFSLNKFIEFIQEFNIKDIPKESIVSLFQSMDKESIGEVGYNDFVIWIKSQQMLKRPLDSEVLGIDRIQHKAHLYMLEIAKAESNKSVKRLIRLDDINMLYSIYDTISVSKGSSMTSSGILPKEVFVHATKLCGFHFTSKEVELLVNHFAINDESNQIKVNYHKFLLFITPSDQGNMSIKLLTTNSKNKSNASNIIKYLELATNRGDPLLAIFGKYDDRNIGSISSSDFCVALSDIGLSSCTIQDALDVADRFKALGKKDNIKYRRVLSEIMNNIAENTQIDQIDIRLTSKIIEESNKLPNDLVLKLSRKIEELIDKGYNYREDFDRYDESCQGSISSNDFNNLVINHYMIKLSNIELDLIFKLYKDIKANGTRICHFKFLYDIHPHPSIIFNPTEEVDINMLVDITEHLRIKIRRRLTDYTLLGELQKRYSHFSNRKLYKKNLVCFDDFVLAIRDLGMNIGSDYEYELFNIIAISKDLHTNADKVEYFDFNDFVIFVVDPYHQDIIWKLKKQLNRHKISDREIIDVILSIDKTNSGMLSEIQFQKVFKLLQNVDLSQSDIDRLITRFDDDGSRHVKIDKFIPFIRSIILLKTGDISNNNRSLDSESALMNKLRSVIENKIFNGFTANEIFHTFNINNDGIVSADGLQLGCREYNISINRSDARTLLRRMTTLIGGVVDKQGFFEALKIDISDNRKYRDNEESKYSRESDTRNRQIETLSKFNDDLDDENYLDLDYRQQQDSLINEIIIKLKHNMIKEYSNEENALRKLNLLFKDHDTDGTNTVTERDFLIIMSDLNLILTVAELKNLVFKLDKYKDGRINYKEFLSFFDIKERNERRRSNSMDRQDSSSQRNIRLLEEADAIISAIQRKLEERYNSTNSRLEKLKEVFGEIDKNNDDKINMTEFSRAIDLLGIFVSEKDINLLFERYSKDKKDQIDFNEYLQMLGQKIEKVSSIKPTLSSSPRYSHRA